MTLIQSLLRDPLDCEITYSLLGWSITNRKANFSVCISDKFAFACVAYLKKANRGEFDRVKLP